MSNINNGYTGGQMFMAFLGGALAGAAVAALTTPKSGPETRHMLVDYAGQGKEMASRLPEASRLASKAAKETFSETMESGS